MTSRALGPLQGRFLDALVPEMRRLGFEAALVDQAFHKRTPNGHWILHVSLVPHAADFDVTADVAIRIDAVEEVVNRAVRGLLPKDQKRTATVGAELGNIAEGRQRRWTIRSANDIPVVVGGVVHALEDVGLPYLEHYSNLEAMLAAIATPERSSWLHAPIHDARWKRAVVLALVLGGADRARALAERGARDLRERNDPALASFERFVQEVMATG